MRDGIETQAEGARDVWKAWFEGCAGGADMCFGEPWTGLPGGVEAEFSLIAGQLLATSRAGLARGRHVVRLLHVAPLARSFAGHARQGFQARLGVTVCMSCGVQEPPSEL